MTLKTYPIQSDARGHRTRFSDSSYYDEVCVTCGATDAGSDLNRTCQKQVTDEEHAAERLETAKDQLIGMGSTMVHMLRNHGPQVDTFWIRELERLADLVELLLEEREKINAPIVANINIDVGEALLKGKTPKEQEEMRQGFAKWFDIQRAKSEDIKATNTPSQRVIPEVSKSPKKSVVFFIDDKEVYRVDNADKIDGDLIEFNAPSSGIVTWGVEVDGVLLITTFYPQRAYIGDILKLENFKADITKNDEWIKLRASKIDIDKTPSQRVQHALDQSDAIDFGVTYKAVKMAREAYEHDQKKTHLFFMDDWNKLARFKRRELARARM